MNPVVRLACQPEVIEVPLARLLPSRRLEDGVRKSAKYRRIAASIAELGVIEPLAVFPVTAPGGQYLVLDGHVRLLVLKDHGAAAAKCMVAADDEGFTYNHKVNRLSAIQEHFMILRAVRAGVTEERIARSLNVDVAGIRQKRELLDGICPEAVHLLRDKRATGAALRELRRVRPMRQIEISELMCAAHNFSVGYVRCLVATTPTEHLADGERGKEAAGLSPEDVARMEHEMATHSREFRLIEESHGRNALQLTVVVAYLRKLIGNARIARHLAQVHPELFGEFQKLIESSSREEGT